MQLPKTTSQEQMTANFKNGVGKWWNFTQLTVSFTRGLYLNIYYLCVCQCSFVMPKLDLGISGLRVHFWQGKKVDLLFLLGLEARS